MGFTCWAWVVLGLMYYLVWYSTPHKSCLSIWPTENCWANSSAGHLHTKETNSFILNFPKKCPADNCRNDDSGCVVWTEKNLFWYAQTMIIWHHFIQPEAKPKNEKSSLFFPNVDLPGNCTLYHDDKKEAQLFWFSTQNGDPGGGRERAKTFFIHKAKGTKLKKRTNKGKLIFLTSFVFLVLCILDRVWCIVEPDCSEEDGATPKPISCCFKISVKRQIAPLRKSA